jgi:phosphoglycerate dehydrogenase-like enzyme
MSGVAVTSRSFSLHPILRRELLDRYPEAIFHEDEKRLAGDALVRFLTGRDKAITALERIDDSILSKLPELKVISKYGVGCDMIDFDAIRRHRVAFAWTGGTNRRSVAELVIAFMISLLRHVPQSGAEMRGGRWRQLTGRHLSDRTVGIVGCGHVGKDLARLLRAFGCRVLAHDILDFPDFYASTGVTPVSLDDLLAEADIVTLHVPLDDATRDLINAERLATMKPDAILINAARGGIVNEAALKDALKSGLLAGAALDVYASEPPADRELLDLPNIIVTPHIGGSASEAILAMGRAAIAGLDQARVPEPGMKFG